MTTRPAMLVVDDDPTYREMIVAIGQMRGIVVLEAGDCGRALQILDSDQHTVKLILLDYFMPGMEPKQCASELIARAGPSVPIILVTAAVDPAVRAAELKLHQWLSKPFEISTLEALLTKVA